MVRAEWRQIERVIWRYTWPPEQVRRHRKRMLLHNEPDGASWLGPRTWAADCRRWPGGGRKVNIMPVMVRGGSEWLVTACGRACVSTVICLAMRLISQSKHDVGEEAADEAHQLDERTLLLIKWRSLPYDSSTWEPLQEVLQLGGADALHAFERFSDERCVRGGLSAMLGGSAWR